MKITRKYKKRGGGSGMSSREQKMIDDYGKAADDGDKQTYDDVGKILNDLKNKALGSTPRNHLIGEINSLKRRLKNKEDTLNELNTKGGKRKTRRRNRRKNGGGTIQSTSVSKDDCILKKKRVKEEIEEVKAALEPQFNMAEKVNGIKLDKGMERRLIVLYNRKIKLEEQCPDEKKGGDKRKTRRRNRRNRRNKKEKK